MMQIARFQIVIIFIVSIVVLQGCAPLPSVQARIAEAQANAEAHGWSKVDYPDNVLPIVVFRPARIEGKQLVIYLEGDGLSWLNRQAPSLNPTPLNPVGLYLALAHKSNAIYIARPCQFIVWGEFSECEEKYWTSHRFSSLVVNEVNQTLNQLKSEFKAEKFILIGFSGGGALAALLAARRSDVSSFVTISGNLDHQAWTQLHSVSPLFGSLNPANEWRALEHIPQLHLVGGLDKNTGVTVARAYADRFISPPQIRIFESFDHSCCWRQLWPEILNEMRRDTMIFD